MRERAGWAVVAAQAALVAHLYARRYVGHALPWGELARTEVLSAATVLGLFLLARAPFASRAGRAGAGLALVAAYGLLLAAYAVAGQTLDYAFVRDNLGELKSAAGLATVGRFAAGGLAGLAGTLGVAAWLERRARFLSGARSGRSLAGGLVGLALVGTGLRLHEWNEDQVAGFALGAWRYYTEERVFPSDAPPGEYPLAHEVAAPRVPPKDALPPVLLVFMESFNGLFVDARTPEGREVTPYFNAKRKEGVYVERFYGNSVQTANGQLSVLCSALPTAWGKVMTDYAHVRLRCLPEILHEAGYRTLFLQSFSDLAFDGTGAFMRHNGFDAVEAGEPGSWGWGVEDAVFFRRAFERLDREPDGPVFAALATIMHHWGFDQVPAERRWLYPTPKDKREWFMDSLSLADSQLHVFFDELAKRPRFKDAIVVLVGDHSFPAGEHGNHENQVAAYEESFRTPMALFLPARLAAPKRIAGPHSQLDLAPTLLALLGIDVSNSFLGAPIAVAREDSHAEWIPLVQPYDGKHLAVVMGDLKLVRHLRTKTESVYDVTRDPAETRDVAAEVPPATLARMRDRLGWHYLNQKLFDDNRVTPP